MKTLDEKILDDTASNEEVVQYLLKEGLDPEKLVREGSTFIKILNQKIALEKRYKELSGALRFKVEELENVESEHKKELEKAFNAGRERLPHPDYDHIYDDFEDYKKAFNG